MSIQYLSVEDVEDIHDTMLDLYGGISGREKGKLESVLSKPESGMFDKEFHPTLEEKAAVYHYYLAIGHCFFDGNKRTSYAAAYTFLDWNGYDLKATDDEIYDWTIKIANHNTRPHFEEAVSWIRDHMHKQK